ncbi:SusD/RagB family nutrient-binding outer membrane lipoprotein [Arenibacter certesii]|uniref:SusD/RagB family nutrient-binding outer membrane lipoprotein n=1 Tax=Arenibacter certesii TaxID=228955 RepID=A0A918MR25_9FLAO|nr:SusD/RagB family nutrient-binding outer membrane lipoprotein [Arenibacter certesii]GGW45983.1 hypothetical protein GCM10007383_32860 [Arenibacter certesii]
MKNIIIKSSFCIILITMLGSCLNYDDLRENPNDPTSVAPSLLFTEVTPTPASSFSGLYRDAQYHNAIAADLGVSPPVNYRYGSASYTYNNLRNVDKMIEEAQAVGAEQFVILAKFIKAYNYIEMTRRMGDIPLSEAMQGIDNPNPKYDTQKSVYIQCLNWLDEANRELGEFILANPGENLNGDIYYNGNLKQWQKAINAYTIRILLTLTKKADDADINVKGRMASIVNNPTQYPLFESIADNMQLSHRDEDGFRGAYNPNVQIDVESIVYADTYINLLKMYNDPRLFKVAEPTPMALEGNPGNEAMVRMDFDSYAGSDISENLEVNGAKKANGEFSQPNKERFLNFVGQPSILIGYAEQELNLSEASHRGWIGGSAKEYYDNGVSASMEFYNVDSEDIATYLSSNAPYVNGDAGLNLIHEQMYLALAENSGWEAWFMHRRTGVPNLKFSGNNNVDQFPVRWAYPGSEDTDNNVNYREALRRQFGEEVDDRNQVMWLLKD